MAIQLKYIRSGVSIDNCYVRVNAVSGNKTRISANVTMHSDASQPHFFAQDFSFVPDMNGGNFIAQAYEHLKTLPEFEGSVDC